MIVDDEQENSRLGRISIYIKVDLASRSFERAALSVYSEATSNKHQKSFDSTMQRVANWLNDLDQFKIVFKPFRHFKLNRATSYITSYK